MVFSVFTFQFWQHLGGYTISHLTNSVLDTIQKLSLQYVPNFIRLIVILKLKWRCTFPFNCFICVELNNSRREWVTLDCTQTLPYSTKVRTEKQHRIDFCKSGESNDWKKSMRIAILTYRCDKTIVIIFSLRWKESLMWKFVENRRKG